MLNILNENDLPFNLMLKLNPQLLMILYICYLCKFPLDIMIVFYSKYGKDALTIFKYLACKKMINLNNTRIIKISQQCILLYEQIKNKNIDEIKFDKYTQRFIKFLKQKVKDIYEEEITLIINHGDLYNGVK